MISVVANVINAKGLNPILILMNLLDEINLYEHKVNFQKKPNNLTTF